jgi:hypothetical protein
MEQRDILNAILTDKKATRREFLAGATALGLTVSAASVMWSQAATPARLKGGASPMPRSACAVTCSLAAGRRPG